ncbi:MAG: PsbP-related protein [Actinomycetota bacterium]
MSPVRNRMLVALAVSALLALPFVFIGGREAKQPEAEPKIELVEYRDEEAGFSVSYPKSWDLLSQRPPDPLVRLLVGPPATDDTLSVKMIQLPAPVVINSATPAEEIAELQATFDQIIDQLPGLTEVFTRNRLNLNGTPGWYYIYEFKDGDRSGVHARYFLFERDREFVVTFQAFPKEHYQDLAPVFDEVLQTFDFKLENRTSQEGSKVSPDP